MSSGPGTGSPAAGFLVPEERRTLAAIAERIFPGGDGAPGAGDLGVVDYLDGQLSGAWGAGSRMYRHGPFLRDEDGGAHGWQSAMTPAEAYRYGLAALARHVRTVHGAPFAALDAAVQDALLTALEADAVPGFDELAASAWFAMVLVNVQEGLFADPVHGGNRDGGAWRWIGYPGDPAAHGEPYAALLAADAGAA